MSKPHWFRPAQPFFFFFFYIVGQQPISLFDMQVISKELSPPTIPQKLSVMGEKMCKAQPNILHKNERHEEKR